MVLRIRTKNQIIAGAEFGRGTRALSLNFLMISPVLRATY
jgi:hypothetical protein